MFELDTVAPAVPLFDWFVSCHRGAAWQPQVTDEVIAGCAARLGGPVYFLDDQSAQLVRDPAPAPEVVSTGQWRLFDGSGRLVERSASQRVHPELGSRIAQPASLNWPRWDRFERTQLT